MKKQELVRCKDVADHICEHLDTDLDRKRCHEIRQHIKDCPDCYAYLDSMKKTIHLYRIEKAPSVPKRVRSRLFAVLHLSDR